MRISYGLRFLKGHMHGPDKDFYSLKEELGIIDPFKLPTKLILRKLASKGYDWDDDNIPANIK